ncbi:MAG TPA: 4-hydroxy-3-methylbut-2-enyl diphosphate reductase [Candidatus Scatovivens faecipullorum]|nr:4-hydroxy-3-methylbut-2-enyl diphosphate reductase [Candidatus Scatovivens faecipullorum]
MEIVIGKTAGFCAGVNYAVKMAEENIKNEKIYCLGELVHNGQVINKLEKKGMITVDNIEKVPNNSKVIFRAHGEPEIIYKKAKEKGLEIIDLTCGRVKLIHDKVQKEKDKSFIIIVGKAKHPEVIGIKGFAGENSYIIENEDDILDAYMKYEKNKTGRVFVVSQTTFSSEKFDKLRKEIETNFIEADVIVDKTICDATEKRQKETREIAKDFHTMIIIGGKNSSNTRELVNVAKEECENVYSIETAEELKKIDFSNIDKVGIMAGASTPKESITEIEEFLKGV